MTAKILPVATSELDNRSLVVIDEASGRGLVIDPSFEPGPMKRALADCGLEPEAILLTHGHIDHIAGIPALRATRSLPVWIHPLDAPWLRDPMINGSMLFNIAWKPLEPDRLLADGEVIQLGETTLRVLHTPGHTPGSVTLDVNDGEALIVGDLLFKGSVGRTDLPGGDWDALQTSLKRVLAEFDDPPVHSGHGEATTLDEERRGNPFLEGLK
jgi:glyoxylase-like metal-dependent hydrolase (beta-lactamase superfamily II)